MNKIKIIISLWILLTAFTAHAACNISASNSIFGRYTGSAINGTMTMYITCTDSSAITYCVQVSTSRPPYSRRMVNGNNNISYQIYKNSNRTTIWPNNESPCTPYVTNPCTFAAPCMVTAYTRASSGGSTTSGLYQDTITVNLLLNPGGIVTATNTGYAQTYRNTGCNISAGLFNFGTYNPSINSDVTLNMQANCSNNLPYSITLSAGNSGNVNLRYMTQGTNQLNYNLYRNSNHSQIWGMTIGADAYQGIGSATTQNIPIYGRIPAGQYVASGSYADTITATINY